MEGRTSSRSVIFFDPVPVRGRIIRAAAEFSWTAPRISTSGTFVQTNQARDGLDTGGGNLPGVVAKGSMVQAGYVLGGENDANGTVIPFRNFLEDGGMGALQIALRNDMLQIDDPVSVPTGWRPTRSG